MDNEKVAPSEFAVASLVMGIFSFIHIFNIEKPIIAIVFGIMALQRIGPGAQARGKKFAIAGIVLGLAAFVVITMLTVKFLPVLLKIQQQIQQQMTSGVK